MRLRLSVLAAALAFAPFGCRRTIPPGSVTDATAMGDWNEWRDLTPLVEVAKTHAPKPTVQALEEASELLRAGKAKSADERLARAANTSGRHFVAIARADVAALHFTVCIRGIALRLEDGVTPNPTDRKMDFSEETRVSPGDISIEATLTNLDAALESETPAVSTQARIARARIAAFSQRCAPNDDVAALSQRTVEGDLATLAAEGHLTPDLAYLWAGVQMTKFSGSAARPFLQQAREGGFDHPAVTFMLAVIALEERNLEKADELAKEAGTRYLEAGDEQNVAEAYFLRAEVARARKDLPTARSHYSKALENSPRHMPAMLALAGLTMKAKGEADAVTYLNGMLPRLWDKGPLDAGKAREVAENLEALVILATDPMTAQLLRDALLEKIDTEPAAMRRGLRYFYAAMLDVSLREYDSAHGHGVLAKEEFTETDVQPPVDVAAFLERLTRASG